MGGSRDRREVSTLYYALLLSTTLYYALLLSTTLYYALLLSTTLYYSLLRSTTLYYALLRSTTLYYALLRSTAVETDADAHSPADNPHTHTRTSSFSREAIEQREMVEQQRKQALDHLKQHSVLLPPPPSSVMDFGDIWAEADVDMTFYFILP
jgi:hypothetical protein